MIDLVKSVLKRHHMTQAALASIMGVTERTVFGWKAGKVVPSIDTIERLENMDRDDWTPPPGVMITDRRKDRYATA